MSKKRYFNLIIFSLLMLFINCPSAKAIMVTQGFYYEVTYVENAPFWELDIGDHITGHVTFDDVHIPAVGAFEIWSVGMYGLPVPGVKDMQPFALSIDFGPWHLTEQDDRDFGEGFPYLKFLDGQLHALDLRHPDCDLGGLSQFVFDRNFYALGATQPWIESYVIRGGPLTLLTAAVPEPTAFWLLGTGLVGLAAYRRKITNPVEGSN